MWAAGRRAGASFFALHRDYFIVTRNFAAVYLDLVPSSSFTVTCGYSAIYRDWQKTWHRDPPAGGTPTQLNRRAVMGNSADHVTVNLDNFAILDSFLLPRQFRYQRN